MPQCGNDFGIFPFRFLQSLAGGRFLLRLAEIQVGCGYDIKIPSSAILDLRCNSVAF